MKSSGRKSSKRRAARKADSTTAERITAAIRKATSEVFRRNKLLGEPIVVWRDGKVVILPPEQIPDLAD